MQKSVIFREGIRMGGDWVERHAKIKKIVDNEEDCVDIYDMAKKIDSNFQTVRQHFEVMKLDGYGNFVDSEKKIFCTVKNPTKIFKYMTKEDMKSQA
ncbi:MAG: hypothetical protein U9R21_03330 [Candidatus Thermoplasmatota archaeon]|nr:hypothetical protein [Candidatus Thermoplasmatota archaeon]